ncbi:TPA: response regulator [Candidatus Woesearchaeota archaeon]|nr:response regulator [Candidatus Woesearchaeota archaeon]
MQKKTVAIADDSQLIRQIYTDFLKAIDCPFRILEACEGSSLADIVRNNSIDVVITDYDMRSPLSGVDFIIEQRFYENLTGSQRVPIVLVSSDPPVKEAIFAGATKVIFKNDYSEENITRFVIDSVLPDKDTIERLIRNEPHVEGIIPAEDWAMPKISYGLFGKEGKKAKEYVTEILFLLRLPYLIDNFGENHQARREWGGNMARRFFWATDSPVLANAMRFNKYFGIAGVLKHLNEWYLGSNKEEAKEEIKTFETMLTMYKNELSSDQQLNAAKQMKQQAYNILQLYEKKKSSITQSLAYMFLRPYRLARDDTISHSQKDASSVNITLPNFSEFISSRNKTALYLTYLPKLQKELEMQGGNEPKYLRELRLYNHSAYGRLVSTIGPVINELATGRTVHPNNLHPIYAAYRLQRIEQEIHHLWNNDNQK